MSDVIGEMLSKIGSIAVNSIEIQKEQEFAKAKKFVDSRIIEMSMYETPLSEIDTKEKYQGLINSGSEFVYKELMSSVFPGKVPMASSSIREYVDSSVSKLALFQLKKYGSSAIKTTEALIDTASNNLINDIVTKSVSVPDSIAAIHNIIDKSADTLGPGSNEKLKNKMTSKILKYAISTVDPYDIDTLHGILEASRKYNSETENFAIEKKLLPMISDAEGDAFQKELTNIIESRFITKSTVFRSEKLKDAYNIIQSVKNMSVSEIRDIAFKENDKEISEILNRRATFVDNAMKEDSLSFFESQEGIRQSDINWGDADFVFEFAKSLNKTTSMMKSIGDVSTVLSKRNKESLILTWKKASTGHRASISTALVKGSDTFQASVLSNEIARTIPEMATYIELSTIDPANEIVYRNIIDADGSAKDNKTDVGLLQRGLSEEKMKAIRYSYDEDLGNAIVKTLKKMGVNENIAMKYSSWIDMDELNIIPSKKEWFSRSRAGPENDMRNFISKDINNLSKIVGKPMDNLFVGGEKITEFELTGADFVLRNTGFGTYRLNIKPADSDLIVNEFELTDENNNIIILKLSEIIERTRIEE